MHRSIGYVLVVLFLSPILAFGVTIGQVDTFQTGLDNWFAGGLGTGNVPPVPPTTVPAGGPAGAGDAYMVITASTPSGNGSKVVAINGAQWAGDYLTAGVGSIGLDLLNLGTTDLTIRLLFEDAMGGPPVDEAVSNFGAVLPAGSGWAHFVIPIAPGDLTAVSGSASAALANATLMRVINAPVPGDAVAQLGILGVDNITAAGAVPEPSAVVLALTGIALLAGLRRRRS